MAKQHSTCPSGRQGGELGWLTRGQFYPEIEEAVFGAEIGQMVRANTPRGSHLVNVMEER
jgi:parvulin-like peptidyl-prolyl isomerase